MQDAAEKATLDYQSIFHAVTDAIVIMGLDTQAILDVNRPMEEMFGYARDAALELAAGDLCAGMPPYTESELLRRLHLAALGETQLFEWMAKRSDGSPFWVEINLKLADLGGKECLLAVVRNIQKRKRAELNLAQSENRLHLAEEDNQRLAAFVRESPYPILECDERGFPIYVNPSTHRLLARMSLDLHDMLPTNHTEIIDACLREGESAGKVEVQAGSQIFSWTYQPAPESRVVHLYGVDVTDLKRAQERVQRNALEDILTGLPNRALLVDRLARNLDLVQRHTDYHFAVLLLDLDRFKLVNESMGHEVGDRLLMEVSRRLETCIKTSDTLARTGGDEFVLLLEDIGSPGNATRIAERIQQELARAFRVEEQEFFLSASVGISLSRGELKQSPSDLLRDAEAAMYRSKSSGKNRFTVFDDGMHKEASQQLSLEADLRQALENDELLLHYQPIVSISSMAITGFEALLRWQHPERGLVPPLDFIPLAEETGLIEPIGAWVLSTACRQTEKWHGQGHGSLEASVNLSARQFENLDLADTIHQELESSGLPADKLKLEITESTAARDVDFAIRALGKLRDLGIRVMVDDFGTGFSSLGQLKRFPVDVLKIDRSFVMDVTEDGSNAAIVTTVILMAHALGFEVVAEGVETTEQLDFLRSQHCDYAQGYLLSRPVPADDFSKLLQRGIQLN